MAHKLVIVESPAKARTIGGYLGSDYVVESSIGHIRDLPNSAADTPASIKDKPWGRLAVDVDHGFTPYYVVPRDKKSHIAKLKSLLKDADELYLATDEDREGEAIAWHLLDELKPKGIPVHRMVFHEITRPAILEAVANPRQINDDLVEAQEARRILDRLYGYEVSPVLWKKVMSGLSAGRVQSVATRLVVDRERERMAFRLASYWDLEGTFDAGSGKEPRMFPAKLHSVDDLRVAGGSDFGNDGELKGKRQTDRLHLDRDAAEGLVAALHDTSYDVRSVESKPYRRSPYAPFRTTTMQQEASRKLGFSRELDDVGGPAALRERLHHLHAHRLDDAVERRRRRRPVAGARALRRGVPARRAADLRLEGQERPGGARGDPPVGRPLPHPGRDRAERRPVPSLRADLDAHRRLADEGRRRPLGDDPHRRRDLRRPRRRVHRERPGDHLPRLPQGLRRGHRQQQAPGRRRDPAARPRAGRPGVGRVADPAGSRDQAARALHRGDPDQGARGARDRPAVDVRLDHRHHPQPRLRLQEGHRAGAGLDRVLRRAAAGGALPPPDQLRVHRRHGGRPRRDRGRPQGPGHRAGGVLLRLRPGDRAPPAGQRARRDRRQGARDVPRRRARQRDRAAGRALRPLPRGSRRR